MKESLQKCKKGIRKVLETKLNGENVIKGISV